MTCPHCGKEIENSLNNLTWNMPANVNACNPLPTFQTFYWNVNAAAGCNPVLPTYAVINGNAAGTLIYDVASNTWKTQGE